MPSYILHLLHGRFISERIHLSSEQEAVFQLGLMMPDSNKEVSKHNGSLGVSDCSHFIDAQQFDKILQVPNLGLFQNAYESQMTNPFVFGYAAHLFLDNRFFTDYFLRYIRFEDVDGNATLETKRIHRANLRQLQENVSVKQLFSEEFLYGDYTALNHLLIRRFHIPMVEQVSYNNPILEIDANNTECVLETLKTYLQSSPEYGTLRVFHVETLIEALQQYANDFLDWYHDAYASEPMFTRR